MIENFNQIQNQTPPAWEVKNVSFYWVNQSGHEQSRHRLGISKYFSETFSPSQIKLTYNDPNKDFKSVKRP